MAALIPHLLSASRLVLAVPFHFLMEGEVSLAAPGAALCFLYAVGTDLLDGRLARHFGTESAAGRVLDHVADVAFVIAGLTALAGRDALPVWLPFLVVMAFAQYAADSWLLAGSPVLRMSPLGRWNGILYFVPIGGDILARLALPALAPVVWGVGWALVITTLLSMGERALLVRRRLRRAPGSPVEGTGDRSTR